MNRPKYPLVTSLLLMALATFSGTGWSQGRMARDPLARLKYALQEAGATALTSNQETTLSALITAFHTAHETPPAPSTALQDARAAYDTAILNQDGAGAAAQASIIASEQAANALQRQTDVANFGIEVVKVLKSSGDQVTPLVTRFGTSGAVRLVLSLAGGPGFGRGGPDHAAPPASQ
jgi:hypothetical protein